jgi:L-threonylcarbamoyladenylate synthase
MFMQQFTTLDDPRLAQLLKEGAVGVLPTDTVYGVVGQATRPEAAQRVYAAKEREHKPGTVIAADIDQLVALGIKRRYLTPVAEYWPGAISVIIPCGPELEYLHLGLVSLAVRIPNDAELLKLLRETGPLLTSSANLTGKPTAADIEQAKAYFNGNVDFYVEGGDLSGRAPSTIIRIIDDEIEVLRQGAVSIK